MAFKLPAHLHRNRYGVLYFRLAIPEDLRPIFGVRECWRSLGTSSVRDASLTAQTLKASLQQLFCELRGADPARLPDLVRSLPTMLETASLASGRVGSTLSGSAESPSLAEPIESLPTPVRSAGVVAAPRGTSPSVAPRLSEAVEAYIRAKNAKDSWTPHTERANRAAFGLLREHFGDRPIDRFETDDMIEFVNLLKRLPANLTKLRAKAGKSLADVVEMGLPPMAPRTAGEYMSRISSLFRWCCKSERFSITFNPAAEFAAGKKQATYERRPFTNDELAMLFSSAEFAARRFRFPSEYWLMPLGIFTGARLGELCQISLSDFVEIDGIHCIAINDEQPEQKLKNDNARRLVPIHSELVALGLLRYVDRLRARGETRLFPELSLMPTTSHEASKWFGKFRRRAGVTAKQETVFHSFRHGFITCLLDDERGISEHQIAPIVGHEAKLITGKVYWNKKDANKRKPIVEMFQLAPAVRALVPSVEQVTFACDVCGA
ncbi:site-specific integrase [Paraburkholderia ginsengisoli]|uniref:Site-specific integrase n=1 Tax=Paraburkholderia ginsengisoli TaxID=311231 RepID=A0A7T4N008_9BURK|nr:site-specific integrase [Paraburkholderia ginsengisoli]QQC62783.1 site-specific integrase [Paraburkholderia ginsengisoli]